MTSPTPRPAPPLPVCPPNQVGPCTQCQQPTHRYGLGGCPLCVVCHAPVLAQQSKKIAQGAHDGAPGHLS